MGLLKGERSNGKRVRVSGTKKVKGALKKGCRFGLLEGERGNGEGVKICLIKR